MSSAKKVTFGDVMVYPIPSTLSIRNKECLTSVGKLKTSLKIAGNKCTKFLTDHLFRNKRYTTSSNAGAEITQETNAEKTINAIANRKSEIIVCNNKDCQLPSHSQSPDSGSDSGAPEVATASCDMVISKPFLWRNKNDTSIIPASFDQNTMLRSKETTEHKKDIKNNLEKKWRRLMFKNQQEHNTYKIPDELRDHLKKIYVY